MWPLTTTTHLFEFQKPRDALSSNIWCFFLLLLCATWWMRIHLTFEKGQPPDSNVKPTLCGFSECTWLGLKITIKYLFPMNILSTQLRYATRLLRRKEFWIEELRGGPYHSRRDQDEDDVSGLTAVDSPVLWPLQAGDADMTSLQAPHIGAELIREKYI